MKINTDTRRLLKSRFLRAFERNDVIAIMHLLHPEPMYLSLKTWQNILQGSEKESATVGVSDAVAELANRKMLIERPYTDQQELELARSQAIKTLDRPTILYLMLAQSCNFACSYCPIPALTKRYGEQLLPFEDAVAGIRLWQKHIEEYPRDNAPYFLIFYGGEPLLNRTVLEQLLPYITGEQNVGHLPQTLELMLCTNGVLIDEGLAELFARYRVTVALGIDGPPEHNDSIRITKNGEPTFAGINRAINLLVGNNINVVASVTITPLNLNDIAGYPKLLRSLGIAKFGFNLMKGKALLQMLASVNGDIENYYRMAARGVIAGLTETKKSEKPYEYQLEKKITALHAGLPFSVDCICYGNQLVIQADGQVSNCPFLRHDQGHVKELPDSFRIGRTGTVASWRKRLPLLDDSLLADCDSSVLNGGGCAWHSYELHGNTTTTDKGNAIFTNEVIHELIWTLLPEAEATAFRRGEITHWNYRGVRSLHTS